MDAPPVPDHHDRLTAPEARRLLRAGVVEPWCLHVHAPLLWSFGLEAEYMEGTKEFVQTILGRLAFDVVNDGRKSLQALVLPSSGSFNRSGLNLDAGARTPLAAVFSALMLIVILQFIAPLAAYLPTAAMAGVLFLVAWGLIDFPHIVHILRTNRQESVVLVMTFLATLLMDLQFAIYVGVLLSLLLYLNRTSRPSIEDVKPAPGEGQYHFTNDTGLPDCPQFKMLRINGSLFFGAAEHVQQEMVDVDAQDPGQKHLLLTCPGVNYIDLAGGELLVREARRRRRLGGDLYLFNLKDTARDTLRDGGYEAIIGSANIVPMGTRDPVGKIFDRLDPRVCATCTRRIFKQCSTMPGPPPAPPKPAPDG
jgi:SulP family sulfate permease